MHRLSTEFDLETWQKVFEQMFRAQVKNVIFIPTGLDTLRSMVGETFNHILNKARGINDTFCGWIYTEKSLLKFWKKLYFIEKSISHYETKVYFLKINKH